jgi:hypothetical protein
MSANIGVTLSTTKLEAAAGASIETAISIKNQSQIVDQFVIKVEGLDPMWWSLSLSSVSLFPGDQDQTKLTLHPPKEAEAKAGSYPFQIKVISQANTQEITTTDGFLVIRGFSSWEAEMSPTKVTGSSGTYKIKIINNGNADANVLFEAKDPEEGLVYQFDRNEISVPPGGSMQANLNVRPKKGEPKKLYTFQVTARPPEAKAFSRDIKVLSGQLEYPKTKRNLKWLWLLLIPVVLIAGFAAWKMVIEPILSTPPEPPRPVTPQPPQPIPPQTLSIQIIAPNGGETLDAGKPFNIAWKVTNPDLAANSIVILAYSGDDGKTWIEFAKEPANIGVFTWQVPSPLDNFKTNLLSTCRLRATVFGPNSKVLSEDFSDGTFKIFAKLEIMPIQPIIIPITPKNP